MTKTIYISLFSHNDNTSYPSKILFLSSIILQKDLVLASRVKKMFQDITFPRMTMKTSVFPYYAKQG